MVILSLVLQAQNNSSGNALHARFASSAIAQFTPKQYAYRQNAHLAKPIDEYIHSVWTSEQGLPHNSATALCQTRDGYLWIGTGEGLVRFDGMTMKIFRNTNTPGKSHYINALVEGRDGTLWIATGGGLYRLHKGEFTRFSTENGLADDYVYTLLEDRDGLLWIGTGGGLNRLEKNNRGELVITGSADKQGFLGERVYALAQDRDSSLLIGTWGGGLLRLTYNQPGNSNLRNSAVTRYTTNDGLLSNYIRSLHRDSDGTLWIGTIAGLNCYRNGIFTGYTEKDGLVNNDVLSLLSDRAGTLWIGTNGGGGHYLLPETSSPETTTKSTTKSTTATNKGVIRRFADTYSLSKEVVRAFVQDKEGALWVGTYSGGLHRLKESIFTQYSSNNGLSHDHITSVMQDPSGVMWFGTAGGGIHSLSDGLISSYTTQSGLPSNYILTLAADNAGAMWVGTWGGGLSRIFKGVITTILPAQDTAKEVMRSLLQDSEGAFWIGTSAGLSRWKNGTFAEYTIQNGLSSNDVQTLLLDNTRKNTLWIGTWGGGVNVLQNGVFTHYSTKNGLSNDFVRSLYQDRNGVLWIGTDGGGLNRLENGKCTSVTTQNGLFDDIVRCILEDDFGYFWMSCNRGIYRVRKSELNDVANGKLRRVSCTVFGSTDGIKNVQASGICPAAWKDTDGCLWFPTRAGIVKVNPRSINDNPTPPTVLLENIITNGEEQTFQNHSAKNFSSDNQSLMLLPKGIETLEFRYTATSLLSPERVMFKYMLEGYDKDWTDAGTRRTAYYTNLPRGREYRFRVIACNNYGVWNQVGVSTLIYLAPYFWETWWFYSLCILLALCFVYGGYWFRARQLRQRNEELEREVGVRTAELHEKNEFLEALNIEKNEFLGIAAHDLKNPLSGIQGTAQFLLEFEQEISQDERRQFLSTIFASSERMFELIKNLLDVNALETGVIQLRLVSFDLNAPLNHILDQYSTPAEKKGITIHYAYEAESIALADERATMQVIENLVSNAVKYSPHGKNIFIRIKALNQSVRIEIQDEGPGISEEDMRKLFSKFARLTAQPTGDEHSTGLGLSIVKKLVEVMNGKVWCESELGKGAMFVVELPKGKAIADYQQPTD